MPCLSCDELGRVAGLSEEFLRYGDWLRGTGVLQAALDVLPPRLRVPLFLCLLAKWQELCRDFCRDFFGR